MKVKLLALTVAALMLMSGLCGCSVLDEALDAASTTTTKATTTTTTTVITTQPTSAGERLVWIPTRGGTKYHNNNTCSQMIEPMEVTLSYALEEGFTACKRCYG